MNNRADPLSSVSIPQGQWAGLTNSVQRHFAPALMRVALADKRRCYIMLFSSEVVRYELTSAEGTGAGDPFSQSAFSRRNRSGELLSRHR